MFTNFLPFIFRIDQPINSLEVSMTWCTQDRACLGWGKACKILVALRITLRKRANQDLNGVLVKKTNWRGKREIESCSCGAVQTSNMYPHANALTCGDAGKNKFKVQSKMYVNNLTKLPKRKGSSQNKRSLFGVMPPVGRP